MKEMSYIFNKEDIKRMLPHREPFQFLDGVTALSGTESLSAQYKIPMDAFWIEGHFPNNPIVPGVLLIEMMAQAGGILVCSSQSKFKGAVLVSVEDARFRNSAFPGDIINIQCKLLAQNGRVAKFECEAATEKNRLANATIVLAFE